MDATALRARAGTPLIADGGMGTSLIDTGVALDACMEALNAAEPDRVTLIHAAFVAAGSQLVLTNTFGANRYRLERHGLADRVRALCAAGVERARAAKPELVGGSLGPLGVRLQPYGRVDPADAFDAYREQAMALAEAGADVLVIETQTDVRELEQAVAAVRDAAPGLALLASATFTRDDRTLLGDTPEAIARRLLDLEVDALGVNCGEGPAQMLRVIRSIAPIVAPTGTPIIARPNAGGPTEVGGRFLYPATPDYVGEVMRALLDEGVSIVGGCCGTGPGHTRAIADAVRDRGPRARVELPAPSVAADTSAGIAAPPTRLQAAIAAGDLVVTVEMEPPRSFNAAQLVAAAATLRDAGATAIDVADSPMAKMRMSAWAACRLVHEQVGIETVLHFPTRGRNIVRLQGDLLGSHALGIRNLFVCVGDPVTIGDYPHGSNDVDVTATGLLQLITEHFNTGVDRAGSPIGEPTSFFAGAAASPSAPDLEREARLLRRKVEAGARFLLTQPVYTVAPLRELREAYERSVGEPLDLPVVAGVLPLVSGRHATFLHNEVPGIDIPEPVRDRMAAAGDDAARAWTTGRGMATELAAELRADGAAGIYVMPQFGRYDRAADMVEAIRTR
ncbi:MAG TPA: bifunctional homocysteine S-methyltransferase/methylenetetrahydrofolate reductase [Actinomycetota bacterium]|jgi:homocysteine S-methyltransferase|nr:bifunctional homocysteine S-methyltransferase/methylenetetrahydrofolate reductase [Actinomycetota bacterium]